MYHTRRLTSLDLIVIPEYLMIMICAFYLHFEYQDSAQTFMYQSVQRVRVLVLQI